MRKYRTESIDIYKIPKTESDKSDHSKNDGKNAAFKKEFAWRKIDKKEYRSSDNESNHKWKEKSQGTSYEVNSWWSKDFFRTKIGTFYGIHGKDSVLRALKLLLK